MSCAWLSPDIALCIQAKELQFCLIRQHNLLPYDLSFTFFFANYRNTVLPDHSHKAQIGEVCTALKPISAKELCSLVRVVFGVFGHLPDQGPSCPVAQFGQTASSSSSLGSSLFLQFPNDWDRSGLFWHSRIFFIPFPRYASSQFSLRATDSSLDFMV
jgi:hypothetical protein